jgi:hypothetical protein
LVVIGAPDQIFDRLDVLVRADISSTVTSPSQTPNALSVVVLLAGSRIPT